jgi:hypothetical protein
MAAGLCLCRASLLRSVRLGMSSGRLDLVLPGFFGSKVENLSIRHDEPGPDIWNAMTKMLLLTPCLKELKFTGEDNVREGSAGTLFFSLRYPACLAL